jgi:hypothetical protein
VALIVAHKSSHFIKSLKVHPSSPPHSCHFCLPVPPHVCTSLPIALTAHSPHFIVTFLFPSHHHHFCHPFDSDTPLHNSCKCHEALSFIGVSPPTCLPPIVFPVLNVAQYTHMLHFVSMSSVFHFCTLQSSGLYITWFNVSAEKENSPAFLFPLNLCALNSCL